MNKKDWNEVYKKLSSNLDFINEKSKKLKNKQKKITKKFGYPVYNGYGYGYHDSDYGSIDTSDAGMDGIGDGGGDGGGE